MARAIPDESQVLEWLESLKNWGRWGSDDQLGCLNYIGPEQRKRAVGLVSEGETVSCARPITTEMTPDVTYQVQRFMVDSGEGRDTDPPERRYTRRGAGEFIGMVFHGQTITHIDAMSHYSWNGLMYNGVPSSLITSREGAQSHNIEAAFKGIATRGVLLDLPAVRGVDWLDPTEPVMPEDLEEAERALGVRLEEGDILLTRTGNYRMRLERGPSSQSDPMTAHQAACAPLFRERGIAMMGTDTSNDARPNPLPDHRQPAAHHLSRQPRAVVHRQRQPRRAVRRLRPARPLRVHADPRSAAPAQRHRVTGKPHRYVLASARDQQKGPPFTSNRRAFASTTRGC